VIEQVEKTTFKIILPSSDTVEVGNLDSADFKPHLKLNRWDGECFIKVGLPVTEKSLPIIDGDRIIWEGTDRHILMYPFASQQFERGAYEYEVVLDKKPKSNKIIIDLQSQGLKFLYQPALTQQEIEEGCFRPDNIVGSYAVHHATKGGLNSIYGKNYKAGVAFHIPRPVIIDARGDWAWEKQYIDPILGKQIITIPQEFLEYAHYPIRHAVGDTFGYTDEGGSDYVPYGTMAGNSYTGAVGTGVSMSAYVIGSTLNFVCALYDDSDDSFVMGTDAGTATVSASWQTVNFTSEPSLTAITYALMTLGSSSALKVRYNNNGTYQYQSSLTYPTWPTPTATLSTSGNARSLSVYCTYTPAGPPTGQPYISRVQGVQGMRSWGGI